MSQVQMEQQQLPGMHAVLPYRMSQISRSLGLEFSLPML